MGNHREDDDIWEIDLEGNIEECAGLAMKWAVMSQQITYYVQILTFKVCRQCCFKDIAFILIT